MCETPAPEGREIHLPDIDDLIFGDVRTVPSER